MRAPGVRWPSCHAAVNQYYSVLLSSVVSRQSSQARLEIIASSELEVPLIRAFPSHPRSQCPSMKEPSVFLRADTPPPSGRRSPPCQAVRQTQTWDGCQEPLGAGRRIPTLPVQHSEGRMGRPASGIALIVQKYVRRARSGVSAVEAIGRVYCPIAWPPPGHDPGADCGVALLPGSGPMWPWDILD
jgi:hypothetical protein